MKKERLIFIFLFSLILILNLTLQALIVKELTERNGLQFTDEDVIITINNSSASFYARYGIKNFEENTDYTIYLPFALKPWDISLSVNTVILDYQWLQMYVYPESNLFDAIKFNIEILQNEKLDIIITYNRDFEIINDNGSQKGLFKYIVGSTKSWGSPLESAHFELWQNQTGTNILLESRDYHNWMPEETFLYFYFDL